MTRLPNETFANIISHLAAKGSPDFDSDGDIAHEAHALAPYATVSRSWQQRVEAATFAHVKLTPARLASPLAAQALTPDRVGGLMDRDYDIFERRYESSHLDLRPEIGKTVEDDAEALPQLHCIKEFHAEGTGRNFAPRALCLMASRMPGLESVDWGLCDDEKRDVALRKRLRADFADTLQTLPSSLRHFKLEYDRRPPLDHSFQTPSILDETDRDGHDKLSLALHKLSQRLTTFYLIDTVVGPEILWPLQRLAPDDNDLLWPRLRRYIINPNPITPSGNWLYQRDPDASEDESDSESYFSDESVPGRAPGDEREDPFRDILDPDPVNALLLAAARAARRMPALWMMEIRLNPPCGGSRLEVEYTNNMNRPGPTRSEKAELLVESHPIFHPDEEVLQAWRETTAEHTGDESGLVLVVREGRSW